MAERVWQGATIAGLVAARAFGGVLPVTEIEGQGDQAEETWMADEAHSSIQFQTAHWGIVDIIGWFEEFEISIRARDGDLSRATVTGRVNLASVRMPNPEMADNLRTGFAARGARDAMFQSRSVESGEDGRFRIHGDLTVGDITRPITWDVRLNGYGAPPRSGSPGFTASTRLMRLDSAIGDDEIFPGNGHPVIGLAVEVTCNLRLQRSDW